MAGKPDSQARQDVGKHDRSLSIEEAAQVLGCSARTVRRRIKDGSLRAFERPIPRGFEWRILPEALAEVDTEGSQAPGKHDTEARQPAEEGSQEDGKLDMEAEEPASQPQEAPAEPALLKALELIEMLQREHRETVERLQEENKELYGRAAYFQAKLQDAQERILMLEARPTEEEQTAEPEPELKKPSRSWWRSFLRLDRNN